MQREGLLEGKTETHGYTEERKCPRQRGKGVNTKQEEIKHVVASLSYPIDSFPISFLCLRPLTSALIKFLKRSRSTLRSGSDPMSKFLHIPAAVTELSVLSCRGRWMWTIFCTKCSWFEWLASGQAMRIANHHPIGLPSREKFPG